MKKSEILELVKKRNSIINDVKNRCKEDADIEEQMLLSFKHLVAAIINEMTEEEINTALSLYKTIKAALEE